MTAPVWTVPATGPSSGRSVVELLAGIVQKRRDHVAITADGQQLTYGELWQRAGGICDALLLAGAARMDPPHVALLLDQGIGGVAAMLGVLRAGLAYAALDPAEPAERLRTIAEDSQAGVVLTSMRHGALAREISGDGVRVMEIDTGAEIDAAAKSDAASESDQAMTLPRPRVRAGDRACLVYTSGSTGTPKGVMHTHANEVWFGEAFGAALEMTADDRVTLLSSLSFGAANTDAYATLLRGATLCLYDTRRLGVERLPAWVAEQGVTVLHAVPSLFRYLAEHAPDGGYETIHAVDLAGEPVYRSDVRLARRSFPRATRVINRYSATEVVVIAQYAARPADAVGDGVLPAGTAPGGIEFMVLDEAGAPVAPGQAAEIVARSRYLSPGYWNRPEMTAAAFQADPDLRGMRRYRTGDAGRVDPDGTLTVLGRLDSRVKILGVSIEPAEVEAELRAIPQVRDAFVDVERDGAGADSQAHLIAYVTVVGDGLNGESVRRALAERVSRHMLPSRIHLIDAFPRTRTGKVDRQALRQMTFDEARVAAPAREPLSEIEERVAVVFSSILNTPVLSREDDFFLLGGTSMTLAQLQTTLRRELGGELQLADVVRSATVAGVAAAISGQADAPAAPSLIVPLRASGSAAPLYLVHGWHGQAYVTPGFLDAVPDEHPVFSIQARGLKDGKRPHRTVAAMAAEYFSSIDERGHATQPILVGICAGGVIAIEMARQALARTGAHLPVVMLDPPFPPYARPLPVRTRDLAAFYVGLYAPARGPARAVSNRIVRRLRSRAERIGTPDLDHATLQDQTAVRVALSVGIALRRHSPGTYDGPIRVIASERRLTGATWRSDIWRRVLTGPIELIGAGEGHLDTLDPSNVAFRAALRRAIGAIDEKRRPEPRRRSTTERTAHPPRSRERLATDDRSIG
jgi:amino acid adenylation domain-containing protein